MIVRLGFVAMSKQVPNASPSKTMTEKMLKRIGPKWAAKKVLRLARENLKNTKRILYHAIAHDIQFYRFSSRLIPLASHPTFEKVDFVKPLEPELKEIGQLVQEHNLRVGFHPEHFTVLNSPRPDVRRASVQDLVRHVRILQAMGLGPAYKCNIHVGGVYGDKGSATERFIRTFQELDPQVQAHICLENDDTTFTARETLDIAQTVGVPCVLDLHHHRMNHNGESLDRLWPEIVQTWRGETFPPKIHLSSPYSKDKPKHHAEHVRREDYLPFLRMAAIHSDALDVMIEAKGKDTTLLQLMEEIPSEPGIKPLDQASVEVFPKD